MEHKESLYMIVPNSLANDGWDSPLAPSVSLSALMLRSTPSVSTITLVISPTSETQN